MLPATNCNHPFLLIVDDTLIKKYLLLIDISRSIHQCIEIGLIGIQVAIVFGETRNRIGFGVSEIIPVRFSGATHWQNDPTGQISHLVLSTQSRLMIQNID